MDAHSKSMRGEQPVENEYFRYSYAGAIILVGFVVNVAVIIRIAYDRRRNLRNKLRGFYLPFTILACFVATSNLLLLITRDMGLLLESMSDGQWRTTNFLCKFYRFSYFLSLHLCSYSVASMVACTSWYVCRSRAVPKQNRIGIFVAVAWALSIAFCAPLYHVSGLDQESTVYDRSESANRRCYIIRPYGNKSEGRVEPLFAFYPYFLMTTILIIPAILIILCYVLSAPKILAQRRSYLQTARRQLGVRGARRAHFAQELSARGGKDGAEEGGGTEEDRFLTSAIINESVKSKAEVKISENADLDFASLTACTWKICRVAAINAFAFILCWIPYAVVYLLLSRGDVDPSALSITIPTYMLFLLYPIISGVCLII